MTTTPFGALETPETLAPDAIEARARDLLAQLSLEEKVELMGGDLPFWPGMREMNAPGGYSQPRLAGRRARRGSGCRASASSTARAA